MFYYKKCEKPMTKIVLHAVIVLLMHGIIVKIYYFHRFKDF